ncbi:hypothetical protein A9K79_10245 [Pseudomonas syringae pv. syringae]|nr:hypothetical protein A9K79_10245 [Pseudomonas syringae pv. syringae]
MLDQHPWVRTGLAPDVRVVPRLARHAAVRRTVMPEFGLNLYQQPSGADMRVGLRGETMSQVTADWTRER